MREQIDLAYFAAHPKLCDKEAGSLQRSIAWEAMSSRGLRGFTQYGIYFGGMWVYGAYQPTQAGIIRSGNFYWRWVDDGGDGDIALPPRYSSQEQFLQVKKDLVDGLFANPIRVSFGDRQDILLIHYFLKSKKLGIDLGKESKDILDTLIWDEERARNRRILTQTELNEGLGKLDLACVDGAFKVANEPYSSKDLESLSWAMRIMFNLRDFPKDFSRGIINISAEDIENYGVNLRELDGVTRVEQLLSYEPMRGWYKDQVEQGLGFLQEAGQQTKQMKLRWITRLALGLNFFWPADKTLNRYAQMIAV